MPPLHFDQFSLTRPVGRILHGRWQAVPDSAPDVTTPTDDADITPARKDDHDTTDEATTTDPDIEHDDDTADDDEDETVF